MGENIESLPVRTFMDPISNQSEKQLMELLNESSFLSLDERKLGDTSGKLTCHELNGSSTVDLSIISSDLYDKIQYFRVLDPVWFSDHCPIEMSLRIGHNMDQMPIDRNEFIELEQDLQWSEEGSFCFSKMLGSKPIQDRLNDEVPDKYRIGSDPNLAVANFDKTMYDIAKECLITKPKLDFKSDQKKCNK